MWFYKRSKCGRETNRDQWSDATLLLLKSKTEAENGTILRVNLRSMHDDKQECKMDSLD